MIKIFYGKDNFTLKKTIKKEIEAVKGAEVTQIGEQHLKNLQSLISAQSFFAVERIFVLKDCLKNISGNDDLIMSLKGVDQKTQIIFEESQVPTKEQLKKFIGMAEITNFEEIKGQKLITFIKEKVKEEGGDIAPLAAERLAGYVGPQLWQLTEEIKKLVLYKKSELENGPIQTADVDLLVHANFEANIFNLVDAIATKNSRKANSLIQSFIDSGENPIYLLSMITSQIRNITMAKLDNVSEQAFVKQTGVHPFVAKKTFLQAKNFEKTELKALYKRLVWADLKLKSGFEPIQILQRLAV